MYINGIQVLSPIQDTKHHVMVPPPKNAGLSNPRKNQLGLRNQPFRVTKTLQSSSSSGNIGVGYSGGENGIYTPNTKAGYYSPQLSSTEKKNAGYISAGNKKCAALINSPCGIPSSVSKASPLSSSSTLKKTMQMQTTKGTFGLSASTRTPPLSERMQQASGNLGPANHYSYSTGAKNKRDTIRTRTFDATRHAQKKGLCPELDVRNDNHYGFHHDEKRKLDAWKKQTREIVSELAKQCQLSPVGALLLRNRAAEERYRSQRQSLAKYFVDDDEVITLSNRISASMDANRATQNFRKSQARSSSIDDGSNAGSVCTSGSLSGRITSGAGQAASSSSCPKILEEAISRDSENRSSGIAKRSSATFNNASSGSNSLKYENRHSNLSAKSSRSETSAASQRSARSLSEDRLVKPIIEAAKKYSKQEEIVKDSSVRSVSVTIVSENPDEIQQRENSNKLIDKDRFRGLVQKATSEVAAPSKIPPPVRMSGTRAKNIAPRGSDSATKSMKVRRSGSVDPPTLSARGSSESVSNYDPRSSHDGIMTRKANSARGTPSIASNRSNSCVADTRNNSVGRGSLKKVMEPLEPQQSARSNASVASSAGSSGRVPAPISLKKESAVKTPPMGTSQKGTPPSTNNAVRFAPADRVVLSANSANKNANTTTKKPVILDSSVTRKPPYTPAASARTQSASKDKKLPSSKNNNYIKQERPHKERHYLGKAQDGTQLKDRNTRLHIIGGAKYNNQNSGTVAQNRPAVGRVEEPKKFGHLLGSRAAAAAVAVDRKRANNPFARGKQQGINDSAQTKKEVEITTFSERDDENEEIDERITTAAMYVNNQPNFQQKFSKWELSNKRDILKKKKAMDEASAETRRIQMQADQRYGRETTTYGRETTYASIAAAPDETRESPAISEEEDTRQPRQSHSHEENMIQMRSSRNYDTGRGTPLKNVSDDEGEGEVLQQRNFATCVSIGGA